MNLSLPTSLNVGGVDYDIRTDFRAALDILAALGDPELYAQEKAYTACAILYPDFEEMPLEDYQEAVEKCFWYINGGETDEDKQKHVRLMDWEQDIKSIIPPINRVLGKEVRDPNEKIHWWTFLGAFYEIGDCLFAQIVRVRDRLARHKTLDKTDREFYRRNKALVDFKQRYTAAEDAILKEYT